jgi:hypothetical protein
MKKIVIIGTSSDVILKKRGEFINCFFDDIVICNKSILHLESHKDYLGHPTIWGNCGWSNENKNVVFDPDRNQLNLVENTLLNSTVNSIWMNSSFNNINYKIPTNIKVDIICKTKYNNLNYHSLGLQSIIYAITLGYEVYYFGIDSYRKSHHYYEEYMPKNVFTTLHTQSNYIKENQIIQQLILSKKLTHIDTVFN